MKIFYAIQGTGNGHLSRAIQLYPYLKEYGNVDFFLSGSNADLNVNLPIKYRSQGLSLHYKTTGGLDYKKMITSASTHFFKEAHDLPVEKYDFVINDFESITSIACKKKKVKSVQFGHQASFHSKQTPRVQKFDPIGNFVLDHFATSSDYLGLHFQTYDENVYNPIIKDEIIESTPINDGHVTVYLPQYSKSFLEPYLLECKDVHFEVFTKEVSKIECFKNICYFPINNNQFSNSLIRCHGMITAGGFEAPAESMYLNKKLMCCPILNHFEQESNAFAASKMGVVVIKKIDQNFIKTFEDWYQNQRPVKLDLQHSTKDIGRLYFWQV
jgi:uncharacterized protein (TIGR00661 family)